MRWSGEHRVATTQAAYFFAWPALGVASILIMQPSEDSMKRVRTTGLADLPVLVLYTAHQLHHA